MLKCRKTTNLFQEIQQKKPDLLILLGDNVYINTSNGVFDAAQLERQYIRQTEEKHFAKLLRKVPYLAIWDNHDFGIKAPTYGADVSTEQREQSRKLFDKYLKNASQQPHTREVYCSNTIGDVKIILLDVRSYQQCPEHEGATLLGAEQEKWLLKELCHNGRFTIICSGITFSWGNHGWLMYPNWANQFKAAISKAPNPLFLGGSIHRNRFKAHPAHNFFEVISSSVGRNDRHHQPTDNYGILDIGKKTVTINLYGRKASNQYEKTIAIPTWELIN